jgi:Cdc6-like AAA superfamily ATPase
MEKYDNLFVKNDTYIKFKNRLESLQKQYGKEVIKVSPKVKETIKPMLKKRMEKKEEKPVVMPKLKDL